jgi:hypothetical protein
MRTTAISGVEEFDSVMMFPSNAGCTGQSISENRIVYFNRGEVSASRFVNEVDNCDGIP